MLGSYVPKYNDSKGDITDMSLAPAKLLPPRLLSLPASLQILTLLFSEKRQFPQLPLSQAYLF